MTRLRWRLARWIAPRPILVDPYPGEEGVIILIRSGIGAQHVQVALRAERFRLKSTNRLPSLDYEPGTAYRPHGTYTRFVGTVGKP